MTRHIDLEGGFNVRDLGGLRTSDGHVTRKHVLIRAGSLDAISAAAQRRLIDYGVKTVIDLRDEWEVQDYPNVFADSTVVHYRSLPMIGNRFSQTAAWNEEVRDRATLHELYAQYLDRCQPQIGAIVATIAESIPTTVFHCYAGKDRTGIIAALLLSTVGVPDTVIAEDYAETTVQISHLLPQWRAYAIERQEDMRRFERNTGSDARTMLSLLEHIRERYGDVSEYLRLCGITTSQLEGLKSRLVG
jgi:protein-tyrosine phosphatase